MASVGRSRTSLNFEVGWKETEMERMRLSVLWQPQSDGQTDIFCVPDWWSLDISVASEVASGKSPNHQKTDSARSAGILRQPEYSKIG